MNSGIKKKAQVTLFVILGVIILSAVLLLIFKPLIMPKSGTSEFDALFNQYSSCIEESARVGIDLAGSQGGRINVGEFSAGSDYAPSSSHLNFLGFEIPYWYYITSNGFVREQVPTRAEIERELGDFIEENINCNFDNAYSQGFFLEIQKPAVKVEIQDSQVIVNAAGIVSASKNGSSAQKKEFNIALASEFGKFYSNAVRLYQKEKNESIFEKYAEDVLRLYAPVDGVELDCAPKIWKSQDVIDDLKNGIEANIAHLKVKGNYYDLKDDKNKYFVIDEKMDNSVNFLYSKDWPTKVEIFGSEGELLITKPIGNEAGLGMMGFCYAPYHFVYDLSFPILIQFYNDKEIFQFPVTVIIDNNVPRVAELASEPSFIETQDFDLCQYRTQDLNVELYDVELNKIDANISYTCFDQECDLGGSTQGTFTGKAPACLSGLITARSEGYKDARKYFSSNTYGSTELIMDRLYEVEVDLSVGNKELDGEAIIYFEGESTVAASLPENNKVKLGEGLYNITVYVYANSSIIIPASSKRTCTQGASPGLLGFFGATKEQCFDINYPESKIDKALVGGGKTEEYLFADNLQNGKLILEVAALPVPDSLEKLQYNYESFENGGVFLLSSNE